MSKAIDTLYKVELALIFPADNYEDAGEAADEVAEYLEAELAGGLGEVRIERIERVTW